MLALDWEQGWRGRRATSANITSLFVCKTKFVLYNILSFPSTYYTYNQLAGRIRHDLWAQINNSGTQPSQLRTYQGNVKLQKTVISVQMRAASSGLACFRRIGGVRPGIICRALGRKRFVPLHRCFTFTDEARALSPVQAWRDGMVDGDGYSQRRERLGLQSRQRSPPFEEDVSIAIYN